MNTQELVTDIDALQMLAAEEVRNFGGNTCTPSFTCAITRCSETVVDHPDPEGVRQVEPVVRG